MTEVNENNEELKVAKAKEEIAEKPSKASEEGKVAVEEANGEEEPKKPSQPSAADLLKSEVGDLKIRKAKGSKNISSVVCHVLATFNNTKVSFADQKGNVISWSSAGKCNFRGSRKSTAYAAQVVTTDAGKVALSHGAKEAEVRIQGPGPGKEAAIRALQAMGIIVTSIVDVTPIPHNGCRPKKRRRC